VASLGNVGFYPKASIRSWWDAGFGTITLAQSSSPVASVGPVHFANPFVQGQNPTPVTIDIPGVNPGELLTLLKNGQIVDMHVPTNFTGHFYDYQDGTYIAIDSNNGAAWRIVITNAVAVVTPLNGNGSVNDCDLVVLSPTDIVVLP
jgi:hypothetical protein